MSEFFSSKRFQLLILQHWADNRKRYVLSIVAYIGVLMLWYLVLNLAGQVGPLDQDAQQFSYYCPVFVLGATYASSYFNHFSNQAKGINYLLIPASHFEKILCSVLYTAILFLVMITVCFYLVDLPWAYLTQDNPVPAHSTIRPGVANVFEVPIFEIEGANQGRLIFFYLSGQSVFLLGSVVFKKYSFLLTCIAGLVTALLTLLILYLFNKKEFENDTFELFQPWVRTTVVTLTYIIPFVSWTFTYFRLKAKQV